MSALTRAPKYSLPEIERTLLVDPALLPDLSALPFTRIYDRYLHGGRLRLRAMTDSATGPHIEPIVNIYLDAAEYASLAALPAHPLRKRRYRHEHAGHVFSIEVLLALTFPPFAVQDVTAEPGFSGWALAAAQSRA